MLLFLEIFNSFSVGNVPRYNQEVIQNSTGHGEKILLLWFLLRHFTSPTHSVRTTEAEADLKSGVSGVPFTQESL